MSLLMSKKQSIYVIHLKLIFVNECREFNQSFNPKENSLIVTLSFSYKNEKYCAECICKDAFNAITNIMNFLLKKKFIEKIDYPQFSAEKSISRNATDVRFYLLD